MVLRSQPFRVISKFNVMLYVHILLLLSFFSQPCQLTLITDLKYNGHSFCTCMMVTLHALCPYTVLVFFFLFSFFKKGRVIKKVTSKCPLKIAVPSSIQSIEDQFVIESRNTSLICNASGTPQPTVFWINVASGQRTNNSVLEFTNINRSEAGEYRCKASNDCGSAVEAVNVTVQCE